MFCFPILKLPSAKCFFQRAAPCARSTHQSERSSFSATLRKIRFPQMMGVAPLQLGSGSFQATFSSRVQRTGRFGSSLLLAFRPPLRPIFRSRGRNAKSSETDNANGSTQFRSPKVEIDIQQDTFVGERKTSGGRDVARTPGRTTGQEPSA